MVYVKCSYTLKRNLRGSLDIISDTLLPWIGLGDFNCMVFHDEKAWGPPFCDIAKREFQ